MTEKNEIFESLARSEEKRKKLVKYISLLFILFGLILYFLIAYYLFSFNPDIPYNYVTLIVIAPLVVAALAYGIYDKKKRKRIRLANPSQPQEPIQQIQTESLMFCPKCRTEVNPDRTYCLNCGKNYEDKLSLEKKKKFARKQFLTSSIVLFPGLFALIGYSLFYSEVNYYILLIIGVPELLFTPSVIGALAFFDTTMGIFFSFYVWKFVETKKKLKDFSK